MKKAIIIFIIIFALTLTIPMLSFVEKKDTKNENELVTIFSSPSNLEGQYRLPFPNQN